MKYWSSDAKRTRKTPNTTGIIMTDEMVSILVIFYVHKKGRMNEDDSEYMCSKCLEEYRHDNTQCHACGQDFCPSCSSWFDTGMECCYACGESS